MQWIEVRRDDAAFMGFLESVVRLLDGPIPAMEPEQCDWCAYRRRTSQPEGTATVPGGAGLGSPACPTCGGPMQRRSGKYGEFWSCMNYPDCKGTRNVSASS